MHGYIWEGKAIVGSQSITRILFIKSSKNILIKSWKRHRCSKRNMTFSLRRFSMLASSQLPLLCTHQIASYTLKKRTVDWHYFYTTEVWPTASHPRTVPFMLLNSHFGLVWAFIICMRLFLFSNRT